MFFNTNISKINEMYLIEIQAVLLFLNSNYYYILEKLLYL